MKHTDGVNPGLNNYLIFFVKTVLGGQNISCAIQHTYMNYSLNTVSTKTEYLQTLIYYQVFQYFVQPNIQTNREEMWIKKSMIFRGT